MSNPASLALRKLAAVLDDLSPENQEPENQDPCGDENNEDQKKDSEDEGGASDSSDSDGEDSDDEDDGEDDPETDPEASDNPTESSAKSPPTEKSPQPSAPTSKPLPPALDQLVAAIIQRPDDPSDCPPDGPLLLIEPENEEYKIRDKSKDRTIRAEDGFREFHIDKQKHRQMLDDLLPDSHSLVSRLSARLQRSIQALQTRSWQFDLDDGHLDPSRLARIVASPLSPVAYKQEKEALFKETTVTLLIDNSGSMDHGGKINLAATTADILTRCLERCGVSVEVLGFTASDSGRRRHVRGHRCSSLFHIIYKSATIPYRRTKDNFGFIIASKPVVQNVDGEALVWAYNRLILRPQERKILIVLSDGEPADGCSDSRLLDSHLRQMIREIESRNLVELLAIGLGHNVTQYYRHAIMIHDFATLPTVLLNELHPMLTKVRDKNPKRRAA